MPNRFDNFNRADGPIGTPSDSGSAWVVSVGNFTIDANRGRSIAVGSADHAWLESGTPNVNVAVTIPVVQPSNESGLIVRFIDSSNYLRFSFSPTVLVVRKIVGGVSTQLALLSHVVAANDILSVNINEANNYIFAVNGVSKITGSVADHATGTKHGLITTFTSAVRFEDFTITDISTPASNIKAILNTRRNILL